MLTTVNLSSREVARAMKDDPAWAKEIFDSLGVTPMKTTWNHAYALGFAVESSTTESGEDVTVEMFRTALLKRMSNMDLGNEWHEAMGAPTDSFSTEEPL
jgi:hypothetical protein